MTPRFTKVSCSPEKKISENETFTIQINVLGIKNKWEILIKKYKQNELFTDLQLNGPFKY